MEQAAENGSGTPTDVREVQTPSAALVEPPLPCPLWRHASALSRPPPLSIASIQLCSRLASSRSAPLHSPPLHSRPITAPPPPSYSAFAYSRLHTSHMAVMRRLALLHRWAMGRPHQSMTHDGPSAGPYSSTPICDAVEASAGIYACLSHAHPKQPASVATVSALPPRSG
jgi:hypothetical protein